MLTDTFQLVFVGFGGISSLHGSWACEGDQFRSSQGSSQPLALCRDEGNVQHKERVTLQTGALTAAHASFLCSKAGNQEACAQRSHLSHLTSQKTYLVCATATLSVWNSRQKSWMAPAASAPLVGPVEEPTGAAAAYLPCLSTSAASQPAFYQLLGDGDSRAIRLTIILVGCPCCLISAS